MSGSLPPPERLPVIQDGIIVGSLPVGFNPETVRSKTWLYDPRPGDFVRTGDTWLANSMLGPGDLAAVPDFMPTDPHHAPTRADP